MRTKSFLATALVIVAAISITTASADRLILAPTGTVLGTGDFRAEATTGTSDAAGDLYWLNVGLPRVELSATRLDRGRDIVGSKTANVLGAQLGLLPETTLTPGVAVGIWDITGQTEDGEGFYLAVTKRVPARLLPIPLKDIRVHMGFGLGGINGAFVGADAALPMRFHVYAEHFNSNDNIGIGFKVTKGIELRAYRIDTHNYYGIQISSIAPELSF